MPWSKWTYGVRIRSKTSAGAVLNTWGPVSAYPTPTAPVRVSVPDPQLIQEERQLVDYSDRPYIIGWKSSVTVEWEVQDYRILGSGGFATLEAVLSDLTATAGNYLELSLSTGFSYRRVNIESISRQASEGKTVAIRYTIVFKAADVSATYPDAASTSW